MDDLVILLVFRVLSVIFVHGLLYAGKSSLAMLNHHVNQAMPTKDLFHLIL
jgi:hypothetical protein